VGGWDGTVQQRQILDAIRAAHHILICHKWYHHCLIGVRPCTHLHGRYGDEFDYDSEAVSVASGGIVRRDALSWAAGDGRLTGDVRLAINDPLTGGAECASAARVAVRMLVLVDQSAKYSLLTVARGLLEPAVEAQRFALTLMCLLHRS
jgi:hypothetical protein